MKKTKVADVIEVRHSTRDRQVLARERGVLSLLVELVSLSSTQFVLL